MKELGAACCKEMKKLKITSFTICLGDLYEENPEREVLIGWSRGIYLATEAAATYKTDREVTEYTVGLEGLEAGAAVIWKRDIRWRKVFFLPEI